MTPQEPHRISKRHAAAVGALVTALVALSTGAAGAVEALENLPALQRIVSWVFSSAVIATGLVYGYAVARGFNNPGDKEK